MDIDQTLPTHYQKQAMPHKPQQTIPHTPQQAMPHTPQQQQALQHMSNSESSTVYHIP